MSEESDEQAFERGHRAALTNALQRLAGELGYEVTEAKHAALIAEREATVAALRRICASYGDNDWPDKLYLPDVIEKHLERNLDDK